MTIGRDRCRLCWHGKQASRLSKVESSGRMQVSRYEDPQEAAIALVVQSYHLWLSYETRTDDITAIVIMLEAVDAPKVAPAAQG